MGHIFFRHIQEQFRPQPCQRQVAKKSISPAIVVKGCELKKYSRGSCRHKFCGAIDRCTMYRIRHHQHTLFLSFVFYCAVSG